MSLPSLKKFLEWFGGKLADEVVRPILLGVGAAVVTGAALVLDELKGVRPVGGLALLVTGGLLTYSGLLVARRLRRGAVLARFKWRAGEVDVPVTIERGEGEPEVFARDPVCAGCGGGLAYSERVQGNPFDLRSAGMFVPSRYTCATCGKTANEDAGHVELKKVISIVEGHLRTGKRPQEIVALATRVAAAPPTIPPRKAYRES